MTTIKSQKILLLLTLFSLSLLVVAPLTYNVSAQPNSASLFPATISAKLLTPGNISTGQTWYYQFTYRNSTFTGSYTYAQKNEGVVNITDWNATTQQCYKLTTKIDVVKMGTAIAGPPPPGTSMKQISWIYLNTTNYSIPRVDYQTSGKMLGISFQNFISSLFNVTVHLYKFPFPASWTDIADTSSNGWSITTPPGTNSSIGPSYSTTNITALVSGSLMNVTVPLGTFESRQINYTNINDTAYILFGYSGALLFGLSGATQIESWYSLEAQNFVKHFMDLGSSSNITIELVPKPLEIPIIPLLFILYNSGLQQQSSSRLLLIGGGVAAALAVAVIAIIVLLRRGG